VTLLPPQSGARRDKPRQSHPRTRLPSGHPADSVIQSKASLSSSASGAAVVKFATDLKDSTFSELRTHLERINAGELDLSGATGITSLEPLKGLTNLTGLDLTYATGIKSLEPLKGAHDFLARIIGQLIGRLKPTLVARARPLVAPNRWSIQAVRRGSQGSKSAITNAPRVNIRRKA
jgi:hypothetical protein